MKLKWKFTWQCISITNALYEFDVGLGFGLGCGLVPIPT
jgi:hypothetical protein